MCVIPGDFTGDNLVDGADYTKYRDNLGVSITRYLERGDADGNGTVESAGDRPYWLNDYGIDFQNW